MMMGGTWAYSDHLGILFKDIQVSGQFSSGTLQ